MKTITEYMSAGGFSPHSQKLVQNSQQSMMHNRSSGVLAPRDGRWGGIYERLAGGYSGLLRLIPVDGVLPIDRMAQANL
jgi:hypothetical protein